MFQGGRRACSGTEESNLQGAKEVAPLGHQAGLAGALRSDGRPHHRSPLQLTASEEEFLRTYAGVVNSQLSQLPQHSIDQGERAGATPSQGTQ